MIYFDHNASSPLDERVLAVMLPYMHTHYGNPSSLYRLGRITRSAIDTAREQLAALTNSTPEQIIFTSGGTEANALALANAGSGRVFISAIEHPSVMETAQARYTKQLTVLPVNPSGLVDLETLKLLQPQAGDFVSIMLANNETGVIQNIPDIADYLKTQEVSLHSDAVQALGKLPLSFKTSGLQFMTLSSHKINGPKGCGALLHQAKTHLQALQLGGDQEQGVRAGTENVAAIVGFGKAAELLKQEFEQNHKKILALKVRLEQQLLTIPGLIIFAQHSPRLANTVQFGLYGYQGDMLLMQLDRQNIAVSSGSACAANSQAPSPVLTAMGIDAALAKSAIRISLGKTNNEQEVDQFVQVLKKLLNNS
jgi:cysteine desulfurase